MVKAPGSCEQCCNGSGSGGSWGLSSMVVCAEQWGGCAGVLSASKCGQEVRYHCRYFGAPSTGEPHS